MKKFRTILGLMAVFTLFLVLTAPMAYAAPSSTPAEVLDSVGGTVIDTSVDLVTTFITSYLGYILVIILIGVLFAWAKKFVHLGGGKGR